MEAGAGHGLNLSAVRGSFDSIFKVKDVKILIQSAEISDKDSPFHKKTKNVLLSNGRITEIGDKNYTADKVIKAEGMILSPGWFDLGAFVGDPGLEHKEDLNSLCKAAAAGGFTEVAVLPNTHPSIQSKNEVLIDKWSNYFTGTTPSCCTVNHKQRCLFTQGFKFSLVLNKNCCTHIYFFTVLFFTIF